ncbi:replication initiation protein RepC [Neokomagataea anthophila]|uniref:Replicator initiator RepC n=1 Tax=Neokomagataea anthophila TaxID=2826925 RepID=A0ABS5E9E1_9PROT|nr:replication initiation protein RepC [Neokomagataea anthophila]MBR0560527.1 replicator initiator RepC [Neokomagataea anthophila]
MMSSVSTVPSVQRAPGRRTITPAMRRAREELTLTPPSFPSRADLLSLINKGVRILGLSRGAAQLLGAMVRQTPNNAWEPDNRPFVFARNATMLRWIGGHESTLRRYIREIAEGGYLVPVDGRNGHRGRRYTDGTEQVGFDLSSLRYRYPELTQRFQAVKAYERACQALRDAMARLYQELCYSGVALPETQMMSLRRLMRKRREVQNKEHLEHLKTMMQDIHAYYLTNGQKPPVDNAFSDTSCPSKLHGMTAKNDTPYTTTKKDKNSYEVRPVALNERNCIDHAACETSVSARQTAQNGETVSRLTDVLGGFRGTSQFFLDVCPTLRDLCTTARPKLADLMEAAEHLTQHLGISLHSWQQGCVILGREKTAISVIVMAARISRGADIRNREAYLRAMIERGRLGMLRLDRSLFGLRGDPDHAITPASTIRAKFRAILAEHTAACA